MLTLFEFNRLILTPFLPVLERKVRKKLRELIKKSDSQSITILDVGGRLSPYTIGLPAKITILDLPRQTEIQEELNLGISATLEMQLQRERSNIQKIVLENMVTCKLQSASYDVVISVEVIEHVYEDYRFIQQVCRVLKPGGCFLLTTPNGDFIKHESPHTCLDHVRHYTQKQLDQLLSRIFTRVNVVYAIKTGKFYYWGGQTGNIRKPKRMIRKAIGNLINSFESHNLEDQQIGTEHLFALAWKSNNEDFTNNG